jgi:nitronate monooxygenase
MKTRITELFGIKYPILQSGMQWLASAELAAAVSKAGGLGIISATRFMDNKPALLEEFEKCRTLADGKPFGVNISMLPHKDYNDNTVMFFEAAYEAHVPVIETSGRSPAEYIQMLREWEARDGRDSEKDRIKIIHKCPSVRHALSAQKAGADAVTIVGFECAGHPGLADVSTMALIPIAKDTLSIPVVSGGGVCDRRTFTAAMALGADGVVMGTRFVATVECDIHPNWKQLILDSTENDTTVLQYKVRNANRVWKGSKTAEWVKKTEDAWDLEADHGDVQLIDVLFKGDPDNDIRGISGKNQKVCYEDGNINGCLFPMGLCVGQIHDIKTVQEVFDEVCGGAESVIEKLQAEFAD